MKLGHILLLGLTLAFLIIGVDQSIKLGFSQAYWAFMIALVTFFAYTLIRSRQSDSGDKKQAKKPRK